MCGCWLVGACSSLWALVLVRGRGSRFGGAALWVVLDLRLWFEASWLMLVRGCVLYCYGSWVMLFGG